MNIQSESQHPDMDQLVEDARTLLEATAEVAGDKISEARTRLTAALDRGERIIRHAEDQIIGEAHAATRCFLNHPYQSLALSMAIGAAGGWLASRRPSPCLQ